MSTKHTENTRVEHCFEHCSTHPMIKQCAHECGARAKLLPRGARVAQRRRCWVRQTRHMQVCKQGDAQNCLLHARLGARTAPAPLWLHGGGCSCGCKARGSAQSGGRDAHTRMLQLGMLVRRHAAAHAAA